MPETNLYHLESLSSFIPDHEKRLRELREDRNEKIRKAHEAGHTFHELSKATGLSRAQVQRICDYSKDRGQ